MTRAVRLHDLPIDIQEEPHVLAAIGAVELLDVIDRQPMALTLLTTEDTDNQQLEHINVYVRGEGDKIPEQNARYVGMVMQGDGIRRFVFEGARSPA